MYLVVVCVQKCSSNGRKVIRNPLGYSQGKSYIFPLILLSFSTSFYMHECVLVGWWVAPMHTMGRLP